MSVQRIMGIETEFGISVPGSPKADPIVLSSQVVGAYAAAVLNPLGLRTDWDYSEESPLRDARGFDMSRSEADPSQLTNEDIGTANLILPNGARLYVDHAHPEYSSPEISNPLDAVRWDRAGVLIAARAATLASQFSNQDIRLYKNNTDGKGASYGCHENFLVDRAVPFADLVSSLIPFFVTRQVYAGAGRVGIGQEGKTPGFQLSQRADFFETEVGLETTVKRPIINTRDEPHADPERYRRLHVIIGDANIAESATFLKLGTTSIVLSMIEAGELAADLMPRRPVMALHEISHDPKLQCRIELRDGSWRTALDIQEDYCERAGKFLADRGASDAMTADILNRWQRTITTLRHDPMILAEEIDWVAKLRILEGYRERDSLAWSSPRLQLIDLQYSDIDPARGVGLRLEARGSLTRLTTDAEADSAVVNPPTDTRAYFRGQCLKRYADRIAAAGWDSIVFDIPGQVALQRVPTLDPWRGTQSQVEEIFTASPTASMLLENLRQRSGS